MRLIGFPDGSWLADRPTYLLTCDVEAYDGMGKVDTTEDRSKAMRFDDPGAAMTYWRRQSIVRPYRDDGKPNRPLTAFTIEIEREA